MSSLFKSAKEISKKYNKEIIIFLIISLLIVFIDQLTKWLVVIYLGPLSSNIKPNTDLPAQFGESVSIIPGLLNFTLLTNNGAAFGMGGNMLWARILFIFVSWFVFLALPIYLLYLIKKENKFSKLNIIVASLIFGGNLGNLIDRTFYWTNPCGVIDFIDISPLIPNFGVFNLADSALIIGIFILLIALIIDIFKGNDKDNKNKNENKIVENENGNTQNN